MAIVKELTGLKGRDCKGKLETKTGQKRVYETISGSWKDEDYRQYMKAYENDLLPELKRMNKWVKIVDMRGYGMSSVTTAMAEHLQWCKDTGLVCAIVVADKAIVKMQINNSLKDKDSRTAKILEDKYFTTMEEALKYAESIGY